MNYKAEKEKPVGKPDVNLLEQYINAPLQSERRAVRVAQKAAPKKIRTKV